MSAEMVKTPAGLLSFLNSVDASAEAKAKRLFIDLEGVNLSRRGTISLMTVMHGTTQPVYLIDVVSLGQDAFAISNARGTTFKSILESPSVTKVFFDVRRDSEALFHLYQVRLEGVQDLQLMELATRTYRKSFLNSLSRCIEKDLFLPSEKRLKWQQVKEKGIRLFQPERGGSYEVFNTRPLAPEIQEYCVQDVVFMPDLFNLFSTKLAPSWRLRQRVEDETKKRIAESQGPVFIESGKGWAEAPAIFSISVNARADVIAAALASSVPTVAMRDDANNNTAHNQLSQTQDAESSTLQDVQADDPTKSTVAKNEGKHEGSHENLLAAALEANGRREKESAQVKRRFSPAIHFGRGGSSRHGPGAGMEGLTPELDALTMRDDDINDDEVRFEGLGHSDSDDSYRGGGDDFAACSLEDCGYCGRCMY